MPQGPRKLAIKCGATTLTQYVGVHLLHRFLSRTGFQDGVARQLRLTQRKNRYSVGQMVSALPYPMILGLERIEATSLLRQNMVFQDLTGLPGYPDSTTRRRFLLPMALTTPPTVRLRHDRLLHHMTVRSRSPLRLICDADSTRHFFANETYCHLILLARNLVNWFKQFCLRPALQNDTPQILRHKVLPMPA